MKFFSWSFQAIYLVLFLTACGGGGGGSAGGKADNNNTNNTNYSVTVSTSNLALKAAKRSSQSQEVTLDITYSGAGLVIGYPAGVNESMLNVTESGNTTSTSMSVKISPKYNFVNSNETVIKKYQTTVRFITGDANGNNQVFKDVVVSLDVYHGLALDTESIALAAPIESDGQAYVLGLSSQAANWSWTINVQYKSGSITNWLDLPETSGEVSGSTTSLNITPKALPKGIYKADLKFTYQDENGALTTRTVPLTYSVNEGFLLIVPDFVVSASSSDSDLVKTTMLESLYLGNSGQDKNWNITSKVDWLTITPDSGTLLADTEITFQVIPENLQALSNGVYEAEVQFDIYEEEYSYTTSLDLTLPAIASVMPRAVYGEDVVKHTLYGEQLSDTMVLTIHDKVVEYELVDDRKLTFNTPNLSLGEYVLILKQANGDIINNLSFYVLATQAYQAEEWSFQSSGYKSIQLPWRNSILFYQNNDARELSFDDAGQPNVRYVDVAVQDLFLTVDGKELQEIKYDTLVRYDAKTLAKLPELPLEGLQSFYHQIPFADGRVLMGGDTDEYWYPSVTAIPSYAIENKRYTSNEFGTQVIVSENTALVDVTSPDKLFRLKVSEHEYNEIVIAETDLGRAQTASPSGKIWALGHSIYNEDFEHLGLLELPADNTKVFKSVISRDESKIYVNLFTPDSQSNESPRENQIRVYQLTSGNNQYKQVDQIMLALNDDDLWDIQLSPDENALVINFFNRLKVIPLN